MFVATALDSGSGAVLHLGCRRLRSRGSCMYIIRLSYHFQSFPYRYTAFSRTIASEEDSNVENSSKIGMLTSAV